MTLNKALAIAGIVIVAAITAGTFLRRVEPPASPAAPSSSAPQATPASATAPTTQPTGTNAAMLDAATGSGAIVLIAQAAYAPGTKGWYARPATAGSYPGVVMIHEWWGLNDTIKDTARQLAGQGYHVLAVDLYKGKVAATSDEARQVVGQVKPEEAVENMKQAVAFLKKQGAGKTASLGWCFGGAQSLQLALSGQPLDATVIYYGNLVTDETKLAQIKWPVLGIFGDKDTSIPVEKVNEFDAALDKLKIENDITIYPDVGHAFANPSGDNYAPEQTQDAWEKTLAFLGRNLKK